MKKVLIVVVGFMTLAGPFTAQSAEARGVLEALFPFFYEQEPDPSTTLVAPFAEGKKLDETEKKLGLPENAVPLESPHKPSEQIGEWVTMSVSEALTFRDQDYKTTLENLSKHFDADGKAQYVAFLEHNSLLRVLETNKFYLNSFVQEIPLLLNEGAVEGRYRWLYQVPVMISYMDRNTKGYKGKAEPVNQLITLTVQIGRTNDLTPGKDILIERWSGKVQDITK